MASQRPGMVGLAVVVSLIGSAAMAAPPHACKLISPAEAGGLVGATLAQGPSVSGPHGSTCMWKQAGAKPGGAVQVEVSTKSAEMFQAGRRMGKVEPVAGVGDEAYQTTYGPTFTVLSARRGGNAVTVRVMGLKDLAAVQAAEKAVAKAVAARL